VPHQPDESSVVFDGHLIRVEVEEWPGRGRREVVRHPGACAGVVVVDEDVVILIRQLREPIRRELLEVPAGVYDQPGESPEDTMIREVAEETGCRVREVSRLGGIFTTPGFSDEWIDLFLVRAERDGEPEEGIETVELAFDECVRMARSGEIEDAKSALALLLAGERLGPGGYAEARPGLDHSKERR
jgi:ADP-ribose pyrophosphatase